MKYKYKLSSLDCAACALNIEKKLNENSDIKSASVNFSKLLITVETDSKNPKKLVSSIVDMVEPDSKVLDLNEVVENKSKLKFHVVRLILGILFSIIGIPLFFAISLILKAIKSTPFATTTGAGSFCILYLNATAK